VTKLREEELVCAEVLIDQIHRSVRATARELGVSESTLRYRRQRRAEGATDGRARQPAACQPYEAVIQTWINAQQQRSGRPDPVRSLYEMLIAQHGFTGSYQTLRRYVARRRPRPLIHPIRRVEVMPGTQAQVDWVEPTVYVHQLGGWTQLSGFNLTLGFSRMWSLQWRTDQTQLSWLEAHNGAFRAVGGIPLSVRFDNCKTAVAARGGPWAILNADYRSYAHQLGFLPDPCRLRTPSDKGKTERRLRDVRGSLIRADDRFEALEDLQRVSDQRIQECSQQWRCPLTGQSIADSWALERPLLCPLPQTLPVPFDVEVQRPVPRDGLVWFEGHEYGVPFAYIGRTVRLRGAADQVEIRADHRLLLSYPRHTDCLRLIDQQACYEGAATDRVAAPTPLGRLGQQIVLPRTWEVPLEAPSRPLERYAALLERHGRYV